MAAAQLAASTPTMDDAATAPQSAKISDGDREREFYRYYANVATAEPDQPPTLPFNARDGPRLDSGSSKPKSPIPSDDKALTAFAQLGALRLDARRCLLSFFDRKNCYIVAEATRTLPLQTGTALDADDMLQWGQAVYPKGGEICDYTVKLPVMIEETANGNLDVTAFVVNDLSMDDRFKDSSFVVNVPHIRFYAGVPIRSPNGHNIGSYCIMDDKPRNGVTTSELAFMHDMAITVMRHLEMIKIKEHHQRGGVMIRSVGCFVQGKNSLDDWWLDPCYPQTAQPEKRSQPRDVPGLPIDSSGKSTYEMREQFMTSAPHSRSPSIAATSVADSYPDSNANVQLAIPLILEEPTTEQTLQEQVLAPDVKSTFGRAARIVLEATEVHGTVFFDASIGTFGGLVEETLDPETLTETQDWQYDGETPTVENTDPMSHAQASDGSCVEDDKLCDVLGSAVVPGCNHRYSMKEKVLRSLLRHYPRGHIFSFDEHTNENATPYPHSLQQATSLETPTLYSKAASHRIHLVKDEKILHTMFPEARSLALCPLWDSHRSRWFAGAIIWSTDPMRIFTIEQELSYLTAFGNSVMAEVARLDTTKADRAKADFISSISHELRSPLHGILGSCELLEETKLDRFQVTMTETIETCGKTLLDTISHVLDFAKINNIGQTKSANDIMSLVSDVDLSTVAEEVLETVFIGYNFQKNASSSFAPPAMVSNETLKIQHAVSNSPAGATVTSAQTSFSQGVAVIVDISKADNWVFQTQAGAWRRVLMNLFGNALKYTARGFIKVKLQVTPTPSDITADWADLKLVITDSGRGMSPEYIRDRLFHSFAQENPLSQGTGLGLSIVRQIVDSLGGNIDVQSELNKGTKITVSCRLQNVSLPLESLSMPPDPLISNIIGCSAGMKVAVVGFDEVSRPETFAFTPLQLKQGSIATIVRKALESICREWYGMVLVPWNGSESTSPDLFVATEGGVETLRSRFGPNAEYRGTPRQGQGLAKPPPVIVICNAASSSHSSRNTLTTAIHEQTFEYIAQPCGPRKFGKALAACLNRDSGRFDEHRPQHVVAGAEITERLRNVAIVELPSPPRLNLGDLPTQVTVSTRSPAVRNSVPTDTNKQKQTENVRPSIPQSQSSPNLNVSSTIRIPTLPPHHVPLSILAVDDNPINLTLLRHWVLRLGHNPITATNGADAVSKYKFHCTSAPATIAGLPATPPSRFDAVLMDISMPHMDGMEATRQIRAHEAQLGLKPAKIIALTGLASAQAQQEAFSSGIDMFLTKPIRQRELEAALRDVGIREANEDEEATIVGEAEEEATVVGEDE